jgi:HK97 family phage prohead protease
VQSAPELRGGNDGEPTTIEGYAAVFNATSRRLGNFHEQVMPGAFDDALRQAAEGKINVVCRYNHKDDMVLGTSHAGTLRLAVDGHGLKYEVDPPRCRADVLEYVQRGDVRYSSFAFQVPVHGVDDTWGESEFGLPMRSLHRVRLVDTAPVMDPAYKDTIAVARSMTGAVESLAAWVEADPAEVRSILEAGQASKFFRKTRRSGTQVVPKLDNRSSAERSEARFLDEPAVFRSVYAEPVLDGEIAEEDRYTRDEEELRAALKNYDQLCRRYHHGEPCVRPDGHEVAFAGSDVHEVMPDVDDEGHRALCWGRSGGLPCNQPEGHAGKHTPLTVASRDGGEAQEPAEERAAEAPESVVPVTLSATEAMARMFARKKNLTAID